VHAAEGDTHRTGQPKGALLSCELDGHSLTLGGATLVAMLTDEHADEIRRGLAAGMRGPILIGWCEKLLQDRTSACPGSEPWGCGRGPDPWQALRGPLL
jgi:hypothetical protein